MRRAVGRLGHRWEEENIKTACGVVEWIGEGVITVYVNMLLQPFQGKAEK
jgi:hypothetical protein